jgi:hypothetical protein
LPPNERTQKPNHHQVANLNKKKKNMVALDPLLIKKYKKAQQCVAEIKCAETRATIEEKLKSIDKWMALNQANNYMFVDTDLEKEMHWAFTDMFKVIERQLRPIEPLKKKYDTVITSLAGIQSWKKCKVPEVMVLFNKISPYIHQVDYALGKIDELIQFEDGMIVDVELDSTLRIFFQDIGTIIEHHIRPAVAKMIAVVKKIKIQ